jgi:hypothetical protein
MSFSSSHLQTILAHIGVWSWYLMLRPEPAMFVSPLRGLGGARIKGHVGKNRLVSNESMYSERLRKQVT